jgi:hypothetical protein
MNVRQRLGLVLFVTFALLYNSIADIPGQEPLFWVAVVLAVIGGTMFIWGKP